MTRHQWTEDQIARLRELYADAPPEQLIAALGVSIHIIYRKAHLLGLKRGPAVKRNQGLKMAASDTSKVNRFQAGLVPWNKGTHFTAGGRSAETRFKPGRPAHEAINYRPIGSLRVNADGYLERKCTDDPEVLPARRWVGVHRLVWESAHGPIPPGMVVVFRAGMKTVIEAEITLDRIELINRRELMLRNSFHTRLPPEVARLVQLRGAVTRQINKRSKEASE